MQRSASIVAATAAVVLLATGCSAGGSGEDADTTLSIYGWSGEVPDGVIAAFEEETGIEVTFDSFDSNETMIAQLDSGQSGYDVVQPSQYAVQLLVQRGLVAELDHDRIEGLDNLADTFVDPSFDPGNQYSVPFAWGTTGILYNEACTGREITSWADLWDPEFAGKVYMLDNMLSAYIAGMQVSGLSILSTDEAEIEEGTQALLDQKPLLAGYNSTNAADLVGAGDACIAQAYSGSSAAQATAANPDVHFVQPEEGGTLWTDSFSIVEGTQNEDAAYQWLSFTLRPEIAAMLTDEANLATTNEAALAEVQDQSLVTNPAIFVPQEDLTNAEFLVDPGSALAYFQDGWTRVRAS
ncbi:ABC transporter substrate-binding protein [Agrococcus jejuensis]|uniref:ABC transporter substrate-binding protein n=1 Tax=Agrococcus jejuensis TaxID=399736 RepID=UPI00119E11D0|nr:spermidine/putrescine ABC transporter substrate-binding protein [Agrococcus jejuensis]